jgi:general secretion pathway protein E
MDIAEKRVPQDGRISLRIAGRAVDVRVSTMPSSHGERVVLRLLDKNNARLDLQDLGMTLDNRTHFSSLIRKPHGIMLVTGPTGSGKSTTLYAGLSEINSKDRNILTVEDPIEFDLEGIGQTQVNPRVDMTFARGLRAILRQDPDVVMVGEIRDFETAQIAVQASLTGHLVLSTLHTNTAAGAITRLEDMGIEPFLLSSSLLSVLSQRLVRKLCKECKKPHEPTRAERETLNVADGEQVVIYRPIGCTACNHTGYRGRTGIHEQLIVDERIREMMHEGKGEQAIEKHVRKTTPSIRQDGCDKVVLGITSLEEVLRVTREE